MSVGFVTVRDFTPNDPDGWVSIGTIDSVDQTGEVFTLGLRQSPLTLQVSFLSPTCFRVRFNPVASVVDAPETSVAILTSDLGPVDLTVVERSPTALVVDTGAMRVRVDLDPYRIRVYRGEQLVHADEPSYNLVYIPGQRVIANFKTFPANAKYCGFGEKAGAQVLKNFFTMTQFNYDNFGYQQAPLPPDNEAGPLNPSEALYASIPLLIERNPAPTDEYAGTPYSYGILFDNPAQSYFNIGASDYSDMSGLYYFGALYGDMDYYFLLGDQVSDVLTQYTTLTGRAEMPPRYVFGFHQGCYGYFDRARLEEAANRFRQARLPCDGLHIDVDFQNNYRTFTHSEIKFPNAREMLDGLRAGGFRCSTIATPLVTDNRIDETGQDAPYLQREALLGISAMIYDTRAGQEPSPTLFPGMLNYGMNNRVNPYHYPPILAYPPLQPNRNDATPLSASGNCCDFGRADVRMCWGDQYAHLINDLGMDMIWQDMMCPAQDLSVAGDVRTLPLDIMVNDGTTYVPHALVHNAYAHLLLQATWEGLNRLRPGVRNFILARGGFAGIQRYAAVWTGDTSSSWDFLRINIPQVLNLGLSGVPITGCDIGGFARGSGTADEVEYPAQPGDRIQGGVTNYELFTRWMQLGAFIPWYRCHYNGYDKAFQEPYAYGEPVPTNCRKYLELRYRLLQLFYDAMYEWTQSGMPIARALFLNDPDDLGVYDHLDDQFFVGRDLLVAPIVEPFESLPAPQPPRRDIYLPAGSDWYEFKDGQAPLDQALAGGTSLLGYAAGLDALPLFVRAGAILPMQALVEQYVGELAENPLVLNCYPGPDRDYLLYQDDGVTTLATTQGAYRTTRISQETAQDSRSVRCQRLHDGYAPEEPYYYVALLGSDQPAEVIVDGQAVPDATNRTALEGSGANAYAWDGATRTTFVKVFDTQEEVAIGVGY